MMNNLLRRAIDRLGGARQPPRRSVLFLHHSYYHFYYLARALRARGWDALTVSIEAPDGPNAGFYHGEDVNLHDPDPAVLARKTYRFLQENHSRFRLFNFAGDGHLAFFPVYFVVDE